jgi:two-component system, chemotaxis family, chemotaxis protein CheY
MRNTDLADLRVLLVEPSAMQANVVKQMLLQQGIVTVDQVSNGADALEAVERQLPDLVISSFYLKDMAGADLVVALRKNVLTEGVPFVLISSETRPQMLEPVRQSGACFILSKPFTVLQLGTALQSVLDYLNPEEDIEIDNVDRLKVLLVDDSMAARRHIRRLLADIGINNILEAVNGVEALAILAETTVDLVMTDYNMPEMDGRALTEYIRTQSWQADVPVLMLTSEHDMGRLAAVERAGVSAICDKPFDSRSIHRIIAESLKDR